MLLVLFNHIQHGSADLLQGRQSVNGRPPFLAPHSSEIL